MFSNVISPVSDSDQPPVPFFAISTLPFFLPQPPHLLFPPPHPCQPVAASVSSSPSPQMPSCRPLSRIPTSMSFISSRQVKYSTPTSSFPPLSPHVSPILTFLSPEHMPPACPSTVSSSSSARSQERVGLTTSRLSTASARRHAPSTPDFLSLLNPPFSKPFSGVRPIPPFLHSCSPSYSVYLPTRVEVMGRLDHLVEAVYERFKDRYFTGERASLVISLCHSSTLTLFFQESWLIFQVSSEFHGLHSPQLPLLTFHQGTMLEWRRSILQNTTPTRTQETRIKTLPLLQPLMMIHPMSSEEISKYLPKMHLRTIIPPCIITGCI